jgi:hypothetical protein
MCFRWNRTKCINSLFVGSRFYFIFSFLLFCYLTNVRITLVDSNAATSTAGVHTREVRVGEICAVQVSG